MATLDKEEFIVSLEYNEFIVVGTNLQGHHVAGAARQATDNFGAKWGIGAGLTGQCYAIPTMEGYESLKLYVEQFLIVADMLPHYDFLLTKIGCGIAGYSEDDIKKLFIDAPANVIKPKDWE